MPSEPLRPHPRQDVRNLQVRLRKSGADGNDVKLVEHDDGSVTVEATDHRGKKVQHKGKDMRDAAREVGRVVARSAAEERAEARRAATLARAERREQRARRRGPPA